MDTAKAHFSPEDLSEIEAHGLGVEEAQRQLELFKKPPPYMDLVRTCTRGDGIRVLDEREEKDFMRTYEQEASRHQYLKFVPASGAATRMFKVLHRYGGRGKEIWSDEIAGQARRGDKEAQQLQEFMGGLRKFPFFERLRFRMTQAGASLEALLDQGRFAEIIHAVLDEEGLGYAHLPKGLILFHAYPEGPRTAFEEHLVEGAAYVAAEDQVCRLHFTVSPEARPRFLDLLEKVDASYGDRYGVSYQVAFSSQKRSTDTLAVDLQNRPFRDQKGRLLFRPGGHGALIENLNDLNGDILFIKNIDNVVPDRLKAETLRWKKLLAGVLLRLQKKVFGFMERLASEPVDRDVLEQVSTFLKDEFGLSPGPQRATEEEQRRFLMKRLNRPIRVCGMVKKERDPGGGPFWVRDRRGAVSPQIVETAQIDPDSQEQQDILASSTHFNPVDIVCGVRDFQGQPFDLRTFVDPEAVFITVKSKEGKDLKALEHPGLWNGGMAGWLTLFVEVPPVTFNPVKTVNDLLKKEHQPA